MQDSKVEKSEGESESTFVEESYLARKERVWEESVKFFHEENQYRFRLL